MSVSKCTYIHIRTRPHSIRVANISTATAENQTAIHVVISQCDDIADHA